MGEGNRWIMVVWGMSGDGSWLYGGRSVFLTAGIFMIADVLYGV